MLTKSIILLSLAAYCSGAALPVDIEERATKSTSVSVPSFTLPPYSSRTSTKPTVPTFTFTETFTYTKPTFTYTKPTFTSTVKPPPHSSVTVVPPPHSTVTAAPPPHSTITSVSPPHTTKTY